MWKMSSPCCHGRMLLYTVIFLYLVREFHLDLQADFLMRTAGLQKFVAAFLAEKRRRRTFRLKTFVFYEIYG